MYITDPWTMQYHMISRGFKSNPDLRTMLLGKGMPPELVGTDYPPLLKDGDEQTALGWAIGPCTMRHLFTPKAELLKALQPYLKTFETHKVIGLHIRVGFLMNEGGADSGKDTHVIPPKDSKDRTAWKELDDWLQAGNIRNPQFKGRTLKNVVRNAFHCAEFLGTDTKDMQNQYLQESYTKTNELPGT